MNAAQIRLVFSWIIGTLVLTILLLSLRWLFEKWFLSFFLLLLAFLFLFDRRPIFPPVTFDRWGEWRGEWADMVQQHPFIRVWLIIYVLSLSAAIFWVLLTGFDVLKHFGPAGLLLPILGLMAPAMVARELDKYRALGARSNPTVESDARKSGARGSP